MARAAVQRARSAPRRKKAASPRPAAPARPRARALRRRGPRLWPLVILALALGAAAAGAFWFTLPDVEPLRDRPPATTALVEARAAEARAEGHEQRRMQRWLPLARISPWLRLAVVNSEDARFYQHHGLDWAELRAALWRAVIDGKLGRGASTLTQQLAKNLYLGEERSLLRKLREVAIADRLEALGKERILELYLNEVEWGDGVWGADAAARFWFLAPASELSPAQAAVLAAMLPAPLRRSPGRPSEALRARSRQVLELFGVYRQLPPAALAGARDELEKILGADWPAR